MFFDDQISPIWSRRPVTFLWFHIPFGIANRILKYPLMRQFASTVSIEEVRTDQRDMI